MNAWSVLPVVIIAATVFILVLSVLSCLTVAHFASGYSRKFLKKAQQGLEKMLPGKNCGACGCKNCAEYARSVFTYQMETDRCTQAPPELSQQMDAYMENFQKSLENDTPKVDRWAQK